MYEKITSMLVEKDFINEAETEEYHYGLEILALKLIHSLSFIIIGLIFNKFLEMILFLIFYNEARSLLGGYHSKSKYLCLFISILISSFVCSFISIFSTSNFFVISFTISIIFSLLSEHPKKSLLYLIASMIILIYSTYLTYFSLSIVIFLSNSVTIVLYLIKKYNQ